MRAWRLPFRVSVRAPAQGIGDWRSRRGASRLGQPKPVFVNRLNRDSNRIAAWDIVAEHPTKAAAPIQILGQVRYGCSLANPFRKSRGLMHNDHSAGIPQKRPAALVLSSSALVRSQLKMPWTAASPVSTLARAAGTPAAGSWPPSSDKKSASFANAMRDAAPSRYSAGLQIG